VAPRGEPRRLFFAFDGQRDTLSPSSTENGELFDLTPEELAKRQPTAPRARITGDRTTLLQ
jgi:hypothetical protein